MFLRTDLAIEARELAENTEEGIDFFEEVSGEVRTERILIKNHIGEAKLKKPQGHYITLTFPPLTDNALLPGKVRPLSDALSSLLPPEGLVLVVGLGNSSITPDALGPQTACQVLATRHITGELARSAGLSGLRPVAVLAPGVLGQTGIETSELLQSLAGKLKPAAVIVIDALASRRLSRLGCTVQLSDTGISPGAGVGNVRPRIDRATLGASVIGMGVPTVVDAATLVLDLLSESGEQEAESENSLRKILSPRGEEMIVTPREIDLLIERAARLIALGINCALQPSLTIEELLSLTS